MKATDPRPPRWLRVALQLPIQLSWILGLWAATRLLLGGSVALGLVLAAAFGITAYLALRRLVAVLRAEPDVELAAFSTAKGPAFDYIVWMAVGFPVLLVIALLAAFLARDG